LKLWLWIALGALGILVIPLILFLIGILIVR
jgi:hypothetical protein